MATTTPLTAAQIQQIINTDPGIQAALHESGFTTKTIDVGNALRAAGITQMPAGYGLNINTGQLGTDPASTGAFDYKMAAVTLGTPFVGGYLASQGTPPDTGGGSTPTDTGTSDVSTPSPGPQGSDGSYPSGDTNTLDPNALPPGDTVSNGSVWDANGNYVGPSSYNTTSAPGTGGTPGGGPGGSGTGWQSLVGPALSAVPSLIGAKLSSDASIAAAQLQAQAAANALAFQKQQWAQTQENLQPWLGVGQNSVTTLGNLMGVSSVPTSGGVYNVPAPGAPTPTSTPGSPASPSSTAPPTTLGTTMGRTGTPTGTAIPRPTTTPAPTTTSPSGLVTMRAPTGETQQVPANQVSYFQGQGAQVVQ